MKRFCLFSIVLISFILSCCTAPEVSRDDIDKIYGEIDALKTQVSQINTNISSMQTVLLALQGQDFVTAVTPIKRDGVELGFTINFQKSGAVTIYHGRDGKDGKDGQSGTGVMPVIGVRQHTDGQWYWTLNGEWLKDDAGSMVRANGRDGQDGEDGEPGQPGTPGEDGAPGNPGSDGSDGVTPQLKIENSYWYISYDEGSIWKMVGPATGEAGASGDAMFQNVNTGNADYVLFTLIDGTQIKIPTWTAFSALKEQCGRMNGDIVTLQSIVGEIQKGGYITSVSTVYDGLDATGYLLSFNDGRTITVHHGKNGRDGRDAESTGTGGSTVTVPAIGARQHTDGQWYWTLNGEWLKDDKGNMVCASGQKGKDGQPGAPGADGQPGQPGAAGRDGITPELKIDGGYWYVSYDNGTNWTRLGKATGEPGAAGESGTSLFKSVDAVSSDQYVSLFLADNTEIKLQRYSGLSIELTEQNEIEIAPGQNVTISYLIKGSSGTPKVSVASVDGWHASIHKTDNVKGTISVTAPNPYVDGSVTVLASEGTQTVMEILSFMKSANAPAEAVDLGLSVMWASWNVGATKPEEYGDYFAWCEIETHYELGYAQSETPVWKTGYSDGYDWSTYKWCNGSYNSLTKYCTDSSYGTVDNKTVLETSDDVAHVKWGSSWRMPTKAEFQELQDNCTWTWTTQNGVKGYKVTSKKSGYTSKSIFLPAAGNRSSTGLFNVGSNGIYWSSSLYTDNSLYACYLYFYSDGVGEYYLTRCLGLSVRPVYGNLYDPTEDPVLEFSATEFQVAAEGEELNVKVTHNYDYTATSDSDWVVVDVDGDDCFITVTENTDTEARLATVEFASEGVIKTVTIAQEASEETGDPLDVGSNLSKNETANTYVVTKAGDYTFSVAVMGNGEEGYLDSWVDALELLGPSQSYYLYPESSDLVTFTKSDLKRAVAIILWEDGDCIEGEPKFNSTDKTIGFKATGNEGGALIALYNQYGEILWSWLIWCTDRPAEFTYTDSDGDRVQIMDRNLGATSVRPEDGKATYGYVFNFGRKDPIRMQHNMAKTMKIPNSSKEYYETVQNPTKFFDYVGRDIEYFNGNIETLTPDLWGDPYFPYCKGLVAPIRTCFDQTEIVDVQKTIYDPCPPGYQVPPARVFDNIKLSDVHLVSNLGVNVDVTGGSTYFPFAGYGDGGDSHGQDNGWYGYPGFTSNGYREGIYCVKVWTATEGDYFSDALPDADIANPKNNWLGAQAFSVSYNAPENNLSLIQHPDGNLGTNYNEHCLKVTLNSVRCMKSQK